MTDAIRPPPFETADPIGAPDTVVTVGAARLARLEAIEKAAARVAEIEIRHRRAQAAGLARNASPSADAPKRSEVLDAMRKLVALFQGRTS